MEKILLLLIGVQIGISIVLLIKSQQMADELKTLTDEVAAVNGEEESAITLLTGLKTKLDAAIAAGNPAALTALSDSLGAESAKLAASITANTPTVATA